MYTHTGDRHRALRVDTLQLDWEHGRSGFGSPRPLRKGFPMSTVMQPEQQLKGWLQQLSKLIDEVETWARDLDWSTRRIEVNLHESAIGKYQAPALLLQHEATKALLEPIARYVPGANGVVDLYIMPAYDDLASLYLSDDGWSVRYAFSGSQSGQSRYDVDPIPLTQVSFRDVLEAMQSNVIA